MHVLSAVVYAALIQQSGSGPATALPDGPPGPLAIVDRVATHGLQAGGYPGIAVLIGRPDTTLFERGYGHLDWIAGSAPVDPARTMYDLASLTKVVGTTTALMLLYDRHRLDLDAPVSRYLPQWRGGGKSRVTVRDLLTHRSGLPAGRELWRIARTPAAARRAVLATPLAYPPGGRYVYSDLGADILGFVVEAITHEPLDDYLAEHVYGRLGMRNTRFRPTRIDDRRVARTEGPLGRANDRNAVALGGVAGHAGLFASAGDLAILARMMLQGGVYHGVRIVTDSTIERFTVRERGTRALGWDTCGGGASCGQYMDTTAYGHTGYTGTSIWIDPSHDLFVIVLANWASGTYEHPTGPGAILADVRADIADLAEATVAGTHADSVARRSALMLRSDGARGW
jgi:CubicO group peptidase (beta-lactamase class C family)